VKGVKGRHCVGLVGRRKFFDLDIFVRGSQKGLWDSIFRLSKRVGKGTH